MSVRHLDRDTRKKLSNNTAPCPDGIRDKDNNELSDDDIAELTNEFNANLCDGKRNGCIVT